ncbi:restriction endonuclease [Methanobacterium petrolearium]|uniref:restriction endonuclease n=1 Tax=Methanobacterium petrolearium TaxID=710190 RepID=UPI001FD7D6B0|nr:restriction endonuclease [Methanobacterium petrolearium]MBP1945400.1 hypothetical protein [Methanobacterium petrolearium]
MKLIFGFRKNNPDFQSIFLITISFLGLFFLLILYLWAPQTRLYYSFQKTAILSIFIIICLVGILAATYPSTCKTLMKFQEDSEKTTKNSNIQFEGHHPDCGKFTSHTLYIKGNKYCPGCLGLSIGAFITIIGTVIYYFHGFPPSYGEISFWMGLCMVFLTLFLIVFFSLGKTFKFILNMALVMGSFLILVGVDIVTANWVIELYFLVLIMLWILTRMMISESSHKRICKDCLNGSTCVYK